ncbi:protocadherin Fat 4-like [Macrobrachium nipponense]|uniref:protocadherin Fat 4-like n=1 Tax=Macrobrachium nipponense TaxID=159736 RepID=UPI0030C80C93
MRCWVLVCALLRISAAQEEQWCSYVDSVNSPYVQRYECPGTGNNIYIWENCTVGDVLFTVNSSDILKSDDADDCGGYLVLSEDKLKITLGQKLDAEKQRERPLTCYITANSDVPTYINELDINEFAPRPEDNIGVTEVDMEENQANTVITNFTYIDDDLGETETLKIQWISTEFQDKFDMTQDKNVFILSTKDALDYETRSVYKMEFSIISTDNYDTVKSATHTVLLFVLDEGDTAPYWIRIVPTANIPEGPADDRIVYYVSAADRDFGINNKVKYNITKGNEEGFFSIDESSGNVTLVQDIDYEKDTKFFTLTVAAQEYLEDGLVAPEPSSSETTTNIYIDDVNDEWPTFNRKSYEQTIDEVVKTPVLIDVDMFVCDADSAGDFSKYTITADKVGYLKIDPSESRDNTTIRLWALPTSEGIFDYEKQQSSRSSYN